MARLSNIFSRISAFSRATQSRSSASNSSGLSTSKQALEVSTANSNYIQTIERGNFTSHHIKEFTISNNTNDTITVEVLVGSQTLYNQTIDLNNSYTFNLNDGRCSDEQKITVYVYKELNSDVRYSLYFYYNFYTDTTASLSTSNITDTTISINESIIYSNIQNDHTLNHVKRLVLHAVPGVGYVAKFRVYYHRPEWDATEPRRWDYKTSGTFRLGKSKYWDCIEELDLPDNAKVKVAVCSILNLITKKVYREQLSGDIWYVRRKSQVIREYNCTGTVGSPKISRR